MLFHRITQQIRKRSAADLCRKILYYFSQKIDWLTNPFRKLRAWAYFKNAGVKLGKGVLLKGLSYDIIVGKDLQIYDHCVIEMVGDAAKLAIGQGCLLSYGVLLSCKEAITIGNDVMIGEYTSVRDASHSYKDRAKSMKAGVDISSPIIIADDVWIGRGCIIMGGTVIETGVVVAANSVVKGRLEKYGIYGGTPAHLIKERG